MNILASARPQLISKVVPILKRAKAKNYCEPFIHTGAVYLSLPRFEYEVLGSVNPDTVMAWKAFTCCPESNITNALKKVRPTETSFRNAKQILAETPPVNMRVDQEVRRARAVVVVSQFSEHGEGEEYTPHKDWAGFNEKVPAAARRAQGVVVSLPAWETIPLLCNSQTLVYADPIGEVDHLKLINALLAHAGPAALRGHRSPMHDSLLQGWKRHDFKRECMWVNYE